jgi:signal transduction histidine kinase
LKILHLEDDPTDADLVLATLGAGGFDFEAVRVETVNQFLDAVEQGGFDLIFADYSLPSFDGLSALTIAKEKCPDVPFIFITGKMGEEIAIETLKSGATDYVLKDRLSRLVPSVRRALSEKAERAELRKTGEELRRSREELRNLSAYLQDLREKERAHIAREIHDELGQIMTALKMDVSWLGSRSKDQEVISAKVESMKSLLDAAIHTIQGICAELRPTLLDDLGLVAAMEWHAGEFQKRTGIACDIMFVQRDVVLDKDCSTVIFRVFQEALTNVMRHAEATRVSVYFERKGGEIVLNVEDNGKGITEEQKSCPRSLGLIGMRERVISSGGRINVTGIRNKGTLIGVRVPYGP